MSRTQDPARCQKRRPGWVRADIVALALILALGLAASCLTGSRAFQRNGTNGFPLDDPWIHLQFAKNLHAYGHYSYYKAEMVTSGSTSPLYTLILALGFFGEVMEEIACGIFHFSWQRTIPTDNFVNEDDHRTLLKRLANSFG